MKRFLDIVISATGLFLLSPLLVIIAAAVWLQDFKSPFYIAARVGRGGRVFSMIKFRSMKVGADRTGVDSTSANDTRITPIGQFLRAYKLDELMQLWNVLKGDMSLVGPRPQVLRDVSLYTDLERQLLTVRPGITDLASIVFSDEGEILKDSDDPDLSYNQLIRPWKSRLGLLYVQHVSASLDIQIILLTAMAMISGDSALKGVERIVAQLGADDLMRKVTRRRDQLKPYPPPGSSDVVKHR